MKRLAIAAHPDDAEIFALSAIMKGDFHCIVLTDGTGCARGKGYENMSADELKRVREKEQLAACKVGGYTANMLGLTSEQLKTRSKEVEEILIALFNEHMPEEVYIHNPFDGHETHLAAFWRAFKALKKSDCRPTKLYACEVWRGLDWFDGEEKTALDTSKSERLSDKILSKFFSQNVTKNYDLGAKGRRWANATFSGSHEKSEFTSCNFAIDMTKFLDEDISKTEEFIRDSLDKFCKNTVKASLKFKD